MLAQQNILALLHTFECAALHMSFTRAANILNLTQGAVSQRIRHLEDMLGFRLFIRLTRKLQLTNEGARLLGILSSSLKRIDDEIEDIRVQGLRGTLSVGLPPTFSFIWLMPRLEEFALRWPNLNINFRVRAGLINFNHERVDIAIYYGMQKYPDLYCERLADEWLVPVCTPALSQRIRQDNNWFEKVRFIHASESVDSQDTFSEWREWCSATQTELPLEKNFMSFNNCHMSIEAALTGSGIAMGRKQLVKNYIAEGKLTIPFNKEVQAKRGYDLIMPRENRSRPGVKALTEWVRSIINE
ncbi:TPA: LysR family transcriptional regulator [Enterobacter cloacae]|nr:LysR family transcriptional regulator [Enterobacter cloacae]